MSKKKKKPDVYIIKDGEAVRFDAEQSNCFLGCCDCNLVHHVLLYEICKDKSGNDVLSPLKRPVAIRMFRDDEATRWRRRKKPK